MEEAASERLRRSLYDLLERQDASGAATVAVDRGLVLLILVNIAASVLDTVPAIVAAHGRVLGLIEDVSLVVFTLEYMARLWVAPEDPLRRHMSAWRARWQWARSFAGIIDFLAFAPFLLGYLINIDLRVALLLRLLRFFKIARYSPGFRSLLLAIRMERHALGACLVILGAVVLVAATAMYLVEGDAQPDKFGTIPDAMWWAVATATTVGYGDVVPVTALGRIVAALTMVTGLIMLALPIAIIATSFANVIARNEFVVTAGMVARVPLFASVDAQFILEALPKIATHSYDPGQAILRKGEPPSALHVVTAGKVEVEQARQRRSLGPGEVFGGHRRAAQEQYGMNVRALTGSSSW